MKRTTFAKNLISTRKSKGVSQRDLSKLTGISTRMIAYYESKSSIPSFDVLQKLSKALEVNIVELVDPEASNIKLQDFDTRTLKKIKLLEQLPKEDQKKVVDYIKDLIEKNKAKQLTGSIK